MDAKTASMTLFANRSETIVAAKPLAVAFPADSFPASVAAKRLSATIFAHPLASAMLASIHFDHSRLAD